MSALRLINETEITSAVNSVNVTDVFSADFDIYFATISNVSSDSTSHDNTRMRFVNASGSVISSSNYDNAQLDMHAENAHSQIRGTNADSTGLAFAMTNDLEPEGISNSYYFFNPYSSSSYTFAIQQGSARLAGVFRTGKGIAVLKQLTSITGFQIYQATSSINLNSGFIRTYGLRVDS